MAFDIQDVWKKMLSAVSSVLSSELPKVQDCVKAALEEERDALQAIAMARLNGEINDAEMQSQLEDEKDVLKVSLLACQVQGKMAAQEAINAAAHVLSDAVRTALKAL